MSWQAGVVNVGKAINKRKGFLISDYLLRTGVRLCGRILAASSMEFQPHYRKLIRAIAVERKGFILKCTYVFVVGNGSETVATGP